MKLIAGLILISILLVGYYDTPYVQGERIYTDKCQNCHMEDGSGLESLIKPINKSKYLGSNEIVCIIKSGILDTIRSSTAYLPLEMPAFKKLTNAEIANLVNFINKKWGNNFKERTILEIDNAIKACD